MMIHRTCFGERRTISLFKEVGSNFKEWKDDGMDRYIKTPWQKGGSNYERVMGVVGAGVSTITELPDYLLGGIVDKKVTAERFNTGRDVRELLKDVVTLHPLRALTDLIRLPGDLVRDSVVLAGGLHGSKNSQAA